jgi:hypothetical protein
MSGRNNVPGCRAWGGAQSALITSSKPHLSRAPSAGPGNPRLAGRQSLARDTGQPGTQAGLRARLEGVAEGHYSVRQVARHTLRQGRGLHLWQMGNASLD